MAENGAEFGVLGPLQIRVDGQPVPLGTPKQRAVLAMLVINRNRPVATEALIEAAWEQFPPPDSARQPPFLRVQPPQAARPASASTPARRWPAHHRDTGLTVPESDCDIGRFALGKTAGVQAAAAGKFEQASQYLSAALAEWRGPVLEDLRDFQFVDAFATALMEDKMLAHTALAEAEIACGRSYAVIGELESLTAEHPYREPLWAQLITAYYLAERQSDALEAYRRLKTTLAEDLGIDPGPPCRHSTSGSCARSRWTSSGSRGPPPSTPPRRWTSAPRSAAHPRSPCCATRPGDEYPLVAAATRIGRLPDNDIVLDDANVSRHHAVIIDTGTSFVISDLRSANGVDVRGERIRASVTLADGDHIRICDHEFVFEMQGPEA